ncbi:Uncharacterised protein [Mycobacterium tuberculosis]|uniref:Uncharacterized protein n=1 Tax=Mycobacterium tuberculosis TaxID=1773 RepID=A0A655IXS8_MYCTX|nr:Uncharacterised protein [Mycobacterium tuberculosis]CKP19015.1 Uncharacterised protein [Mycobacterium tuberculosis]CNV65754.1 Uncharacterised protein [Mycobacterium tuberculosis]CNV78241.1 Uncharacterised protein [Mycobacterium tuberculosis]COW25127.1 Uncharacterised protein [Mycobacterium tuberculosis]
MNSLRRLATDRAINGASSGSGVRPGGSEYNSAYAKSSNTVAGNTDATSVPTVIETAVAAIVPGTGRPGFASRA